MGLKFWRNSKDDDDDLDSDSTPGSKEQRSKKIELIRASVKCPNCGHWGSRSIMTVHGYLTYRCPAPKDECRVDAYRVYKYTPKDIREWNKFHAEEGDEISMPDEREEGE